jgi:5-methylcytosine-specific restriction endonuclease McrA
MKSLERTDVHRIFSIGEINNILENHPNSKHIKIGDKSIPLSNARIYFTNGFTCHNCGVSGDEFRLTSDELGKKHLDLYSSEENRLILFDLIIPKQNGGADEDFNLLPTCSECYPKVYNKIKIEHINPDLIDWISKTLGFEYLNYLCEMNEIKYLP